MTALPPNTPAQPTPPQPTGATPRYNVAPPRNGDADNIAAPAAQPAPAEPAAPMTSAAPAAASAAPAAAPVPPAAPHGTVPPPPPPAAPTAAPQQAATDALPNILVNYWLSVFFTWVPALIFYLLEKDKGQSLAWRYHLANLNFSLVRTIASVGAFVFAGIPFLGELISVLLGLASLVLFIFHIIAAVKASTNYREGKEPEFIFNLQMVK